MKNWSNMLSFLSFFLQLSLQNFSHLFPSRLVLLIDPDYLEAGLPRHDIHLPTPGFYRPPCFARTPPATSRKTSPFPLSYILHILSSTPTNFNHKLTFLSHSSILHLYPSHFSTLMLHPTQTHAAIDVVLFSLRLFSPCLCPSPYTCDSSHRFKFCHPHVQQPSDRESASPPKQFLASSSLFTAIDGRFQRENFVRQKDQFGVISKFYLRSQMW